MQADPKHIAVVLFPEGNSALEKIYGLTIVERTVHALERGGAGVVVIPAFVKERVRAALAVNKAWKTEIRYADHWPEEIKKEGVLLLADPLVLDPKVVQAFFEIPSDHPKIKMSGNGRLAFLPQSCAGKTGLGVKGFSQDLEQWLSAADPTGKQREVLDLPGLICQAVQTPEDKKAVKKALIRSLTKPTDGWVSRHLNRPVSTLISRVLAYTPVTPNQFTLITGVFGLATGVFAAMGGYWNYLIAGALFHLTSILDGVDGELARLKFKSSPFGQWLDTLVDNLSYVAGLAGIVTGILRTGATDAVKVAAALAVIFVILALGSLYLYLLRFKSGGTLLNVKYSFQEGNSWFDKVMRVAAAFGKRDLFALLFFILGIIGQLPMALGYIAIVAFFIFAFSIQAHVKAAKERSLAQGNS